MYDAEGLDSHFSNTVRCADRSNLLEPHKEKLVDFILALRDYLQHAPQTEDDNGTSNTKQAVELFEALQGLIREMERSAFQRQEMTKSVQQDGVRQESSYDDLAALERCFRKLNIKSSVHGDKDTPSGESLSDGSEFEDEP